MHTVLRTNVVTRPVGVKGPHPHHSHLPAPIQPQCEEPCQQLHAAAALLEGVAAYLLWLQQ